MTAHVIPEFSILNRKRLLCTALCEDAAFLGITRQPTERRIQQRLGSDLAMCLLISGGGSWRGRIAASTTESTVTGR
jgi:hypothetical protein